MDLSGPPQAILAALYFAGYWVQFDSFGADLFCAGHGGTGGSALQ